jgi:hypothetical protein
MAIQLTGERSWKILIRHLAQPAEFRLDRRSATMQNPRHHAGRSIFFAR